MKRFGDLYNKISSKENLILAASKFISSRSMNGFDMNKKYKEGTFFHFVQHQEEILEKVHEQLQSETFEFGGLTSFVVHEPKKRLIHHPKRCEDRVVHYAIMNVIEPLVNKKFTNDTYASIKSKGIKDAVIKLQQVIKNNPAWYFLKVDVKKYYDRNI